MFSKSVEVHEMKTPRNDIILTDMALGLLIMVTITLIWLQIWLQISIANNRR